METWDLSACHPFPRLSDVLLAARLDDQEFAKTGPKNWGKYVEHLNAAMLTTMYNLTCVTSWHRGAKFYGTKKACFQIVCLFNPKDSQLPPEYIPRYHSVPTRLRLFTQMSHSGTLVDSNAPMKISVLCQVIQTWNVWCRVARRKFAFVVLKVKLDTNDSMLGKIWQGVVPFFPNSFNY